MLNLLFIRLIGQAILMTCILSLALVITGVPVKVAIKIAGYLWFIVMPMGNHLARQLFPMSNGPFVSVGLGVALGLLMHPLTVVPFWILGKVEAHTWAACIAAGVFWSYELLKQRKSGEISSRDDRTFWFVVIVATLISIICFLASSNTRAVLAHFQVQAIGVQALAVGFPLEHPYVGGIPYRDNFGVHLSLLAISKGIDVAIADLGLYVAQMTYLWLAVFTLGIVGRVWLGLSGFACIAAMVASYLILGRSPVNSEIFGSNLSESAMQTLSPLLGHIGFLISMMLFSRLASSQESKISKVGALALVFLAGSTMLGRANAGALLGLSVWAYWLYRVLKTQTLQIKTATYVFAIGVGCISAMILSLGSPVGGEFSGTGFLKFGVSPTLEFLSDSPVSRLAQSSGFSLFVGGIFAYLIFVLLNASFLAPFFWVRTSSILRGKCSNDEILILVSVSMGVTTSLFTFAAGGSNFVFFQTAKLGMCLLGARGMDLAVDSWSQRERRFSLKVILAICLCLATIHLYDIVHQYRKLKPLNRAFTPVAIETLLRRPFDMAPILEKIDPTNKTRFMFVHGGENIWGYSGRVSATMRKFNLRLVVHDQVRYMVTFTNNNKTASLAQLWNNFVKLDNSAIGGLLDLPCVYEIANSPPSHTEEIYLISAKNLQILNHPGVKQVAESSDMVAWKVNRSQEWLSANICR